MKRRTLSFMSALGLAIAFTGGIQTVNARQIVPVQVRTEVDYPLIHSSANGHRVVIKIDVEGTKGTSLDRSPVNLAVVLDRSGSMSGGKLEQAKQAAHMLVDQLDENDVISLVIYDTEVEVLVSAQKLGNRTREIHRKIDQIRTGGSTALFDGVKTGGQQLREFLDSRRINRVMLLSDGIANVGPSSNREIAHLGQELATDDISVTTIGLGDDYNENLMTALAEASDANYYYVADVEALPKVFREELGELKSLVARDIVIRIECPKGVRPLRILGRNETIKSNQEEIVFKTLAAEQTREILIECMVEPEAIGSVSEIANVGIEYSNMDSEGKIEFQRTVVVGYSDDVKMVSKTQNREVSAEAAIYGNAAETELAIALADKGDLLGCKVQLESQAAKLQEAWVAAPAANKAAIAAEIVAVEQVKDELAEEGLTKTRRKELQSRSYLLRNSKVK